MLITCVQEFLAALNASANKPLRFLLVRRQWRDQTHQSFFPSTREHKFEAIMPSVEDILGGFLKPMGQACRGMRASLDMLDSNRARRGWPTESIALRSDDSFVQCAFDGERLLVPRGCGSLRAVAGSCWQSRCSRQRVMSGECVHVDAVLLADARASREQGQC